MTPAMPSPFDQQPPTETQRILLVTGMSGAGKTTTLKMLEDLGYEVVDNLPFALSAALLGTPQDGSSELAAPNRPLAIGIDLRTRAFNAQRILDEVSALRNGATPLDVRIIFLDCKGSELARRFSETRRRHPLALDRPVADGIAREREILAPLRRWADVVIDTSDETAHNLKRKINDLFRLERQEKLTLTVMSFGFARGVPRDADLLFDMRFVRNPHWEPVLRPQTGLDAAVGAFIETDIAFNDAYSRISMLILSLLPAYLKEGKSYLTIAFGCTGGRHRSVYCAEKFAAELRANHYDPTIVHRDLVLQSAHEELTGDEDLAAMYQSRTYGSKVASGESVKQ